MAHSPGPPAERAANGWLFTPQAFSAAPACGAYLLRLLGRQGSGGFLPLRGGPPARFGDFPAVESHAGRGGAAPQSHPQARFDVSRRKRLLAGMAQPFPTVSLPASQRGLSVRTHSLNPTFSFRPAEKRTCR